ncbi:transposase [Kitasatospora sp. NPDC018058]|uniref:transposase n=1 Tax=Kitasatospora sp. NPDC018058 TaxID=3364025 RepID=UPI0037C03257
MRFPRDAADGDSSSDGSHERTRGHGRPKKYPQELRERAVRMYRAADPKPVIRRMAEDLGVHPEALRNWIRQAEADAGERDDRLTTAEREELAALRKENAQLKRANEVLRTASAFFAAQLDPTRPR